MNNIYKFLSISVIILVLLAGIFFYAQKIKADITTGLVGWWKFDEGNGTAAADSSGDNNNGTINGGASWTTGQIGQALSFDGTDDYVNVPDPGTYSLDITGSLTLSAWVKPPFPAGTGTILAKGMLGGNGYALSIEWTGTSIYFYTYDTTSPNWDSGVNPSSYCSDWCLITAVYNGSSKKIYINGIERNSVNVTGSMTTTDLDFQIGTDSLGGYAYAGLIDEVRVYNKALSPSEVLELYNYTGGGTPTPTPSGTPSPTPSPTPTPTPPSDTTPPTISNGTPSGTLSAGTTQTTMSVSTNENATCKYATSVGTAYASMPNTFSATGTTNHSTAIIGLSNGNSYTRYVRCQDTAGNANTSDYIITFFVASNGGTIDAASCSRADVLAAISSAQNGNTVVIPAGTCNWTSEVNISKPITIQGAGIDQTIITGYGFYIPAGVNDWRITGITFNSQWTDRYFISFQQSRTGSKRFRIDHCKFMNEPYSTGGTIMFHGYSYGVLDHNIFQDCLNEILSVGGDGASSYARTPIVGGYENGTIFAEDNQFTLTSACSAYFGGDPNGAAENVFDGNSGPRIVFRYNTISDNATCRWQYPIEVHGFESEFSTVGDARAVYAVEIYNNTFTANYAGSGMMFKVRGLGGGGVVFNNTFYGTGHSFDKLADLRNLRSHPTDDTGSLSKGNINAAGYTQFAHSRQADETGLICEHCSGHTGLVFGQVNNLYFWNNTNAGPVTVETTQYTSSDIILNTNYFLSAMPGYSPYVYPHPLTVSVPPPDTTPPASPTGVTII